jgi:hypothetical protein
MLRILFFIITFGLSTTYSIAQSIHLKTQEQVNNYFGPGYLTAHLIIGPDSCCSDITDLTPLSNVWYIGGRLIIKNNPHLKSLHGLENLKNFGNAAGFEIINNDSLLNLQGLADTLVPLDFNDSPYFGLSLEIIGNELLEDLSGAPDCRQAGLNIENNPTLKNLQGGEKWDRLSSMSIRKCANLQSLKGLDGIERIDNGILILHCPRMKNFKGLDHCEYISRFYLSRLDSLENTDGLGNLRYTHEIEIDSCANFRALTDLQRLGKSPYNNDKWIDLSITDCPWFGDFSGLSDTAQFDVAYISKIDSVETIQNFHRLHANSSGVWGSYNIKYLNSLPIGINYGSRAPSGGVTTCPNLEFIHDNISGRLDSMSNLAFYYCPRLTDATGFGYVKRVTEFFSLREITNDSFIGTENLQWAEDISIYDCKLKHLKFLSGIDSISARLYLSGDISSLEGLENLKSVGTGLTIGGNDSLTTLAPLSDSLRVRWNIRLGGISRIDTISGFNNVDALSAQAVDISIYNCDNLKAITGFNGITGFLISVVPEAYDNIWIFGNPLLESITGFQNLIYLKKRLTIKDNPMLTDISGFCNLLQNGTVLGGKVIQGNSQGANSLVEALQTCLSPTGEPVKYSPQVDIYPSPASDYFRITLDGSMPSASVVIYDLTGKIVYNSVIRNEILIPCSDWPNGLYLGALHTIKGEILPLKIQVMH